MREYLIQRLVLAVPTVVVVTFMVFLLVQLIPGDVATSIAGVEATEEDIERVREEYRLDDPIVVQYGVWVSKVVRGDFGESARLTSIPVRQLLSERIPPTLELTFLAMAVSLAISIPAGLLSAAWRDSKVDLAISSVTLFGLSFPSFVLAYVLIYLFAVEWDMLPATGYVPFTESPADNLKGMILPAIALGASAMASQTRMLRTSALEVLNQDYVRTARAKGIRERAVHVRHVLRPAIIPFITVVGLQTAGLLSGAIVVESVFAIPGLGTLAIESIRSRDFPTLQAVVLVAVLVYLAITVLMDLLYAMADPRIRLSGN